MDVWSWTEGLDSANYTYIDIPEVAAGAMTEVPLPTPSKVPAEWRARASSLGDSGTLVVWSQLDRGQYGHKIIYCNLGHTFFLLCND